MKNKRLLAILIVFIIIGTVAILGGVVFTVKSINIKFTNELDYFSDNEEIQLLNRLKESISFTKSKNIIFSVDRERIINSIEEEEFRVRVTNIEAHFPNRLVISVRERYPVFIYQSDSKVAVLDGDLRILDTKTPTGRNLINISDQINTVGFASAQIGDYLTEGEDNTTRTTILKYLTPFFANISSYEDAVCEFFSEINFDDRYTSMDLFMKSREPKAQSTLLKNFYDIEIWDAKVNFKEKLARVWQEVEHESSKAGTYTVQEINSSLVGAYDPYR